MCRLREEKGEVKEGVKAEASEQLNDGLVERVSIKTTIELQNNFHTSTNLHQPPPKARHFQVIRGY